MATPPAPDWFQRGCAHQQAGMLADAMLCFRRATKAQPQAAAPRQHLGEVLRDLGLVREAISVWREAAMLDPDAFDVLVALAEAALAIGDPAAASDAAARALAQDPGHARAQALRAVAAWRAAGATAEDAPIEVVATALAREPRLLAVPAIADSVVRMLDDAPDAPGCDRLLSTLTVAPAQIAAAPALLLALAAARAPAQCDGASAALFAQAAAREYRAAEHDALRRIALAAQRANAERAAALADRYAALCARAFASAAPLPWPRRTAGERLRIVVLAGDVEDAAAGAAVAALAALPRDGFDVTVAVLARSALPQWLADTAAGLAPLKLPDAASHAARQIARLDPDVLVDLAGLTAATGPVLAARPARTTFTLATLCAPLPAPLHDRSLADVAALIAALETMRAQLPATAADVPDAAGMAAAWEAAIRAHQRGEVAAAREGYDRVLSAQPAFAHAHYLRGVLSRDQGDTRAAGADFAAALQSAPGHVDARVAAAGVALAQREPQIARALCAGDAGAGSESVALLRAGGLADLALGDGVAAQARFERALVLEPADGDTHYNHGVALQMQKRHADAARAYQRALAFKPDLIAADFNLGVLFQEQGATDAAIAAYGSVLAQDPKHVAAYRNLGETLLAAGRMDRALANFLRFEANCPDSLGLAVQALEVLQHQGDFARLDHYLDGLRRQAYRAADDTELCDCLELLLYLLLFFDVEAAVIDNYAQLYDCTLRTLQGQPLPRPAARRPGRLRIGFLSADLRGHVMGKMVWQEVQHHDRARFALHFYSLSGERDEWTQRFESVADTFVVLADAGEREAATRIAADDLDLLVDLSTHTKGARPGILALKPARVQITHIASAGTVGLSTIDFKLTDHHADVARSGAHALESPLPMQGCVYPYRHVEPAAQHPFRRDALGIALDAVLIGAFCAPLKLSRRCLALWREVLERIPRARLVFSPANPALRDSFLRLAAAGRIATERLMFLPQGRGDAENQARYALIDFVLDPMPYGGVNGTLEALDMGVPVVTLVGERHSERSSYSILANLGVAHTIARDNREYVDIAVRLAGEPAFMREVRAAIRAGLAGSMLTDNAGRTRNLEAAYCRALELRAPQALGAASKV